MNKLTYLKGKLKSLTNVHLASKQPNIFVFTMPRSGSTWLMEILSSEKGFRYCNEPLYLRSSVIRHYSGLNNPEDVHDPANLPKIEKYFQGLANGSLGFMNPNPFSSNYRPFTNRVVFKIIHGGEELIGWFQKRFNGKIIFMTRHPIAVSVSRNLLPRTQAMLNSHYASFFEPSQIAFGKEILEKGNFFEQAVLDWCLQNYVPLKQRNQSWIFLTYEQLVLEPEKVLYYLQGQLNLKSIDKMLANLTKPSLVLELSDKETQAMLKDKSSNRDALVSKWTKKVTPAMEQRCFEILDVFNIDLYKAGRFTALDHYLI